MIDAVIFTIGVYTYIVSQQLRYKRYIVVCNSGDIKNAITAPQRSLGIEVGRIRTYYYNTGALPMFYRNT